MRQARLCLLLLGVAAVALLGCDLPKGAVIGESKEGQQLPPIRVDLPPPPSFAEPVIPVRHPDGTFSVAGLRRNVDKNIDQEVRVKGYLIEEYKCPTCPKGQTCKLCDRPHFWLGDEKSTPKEKAMLVSDYPTPPKNAKEAAARKGLPPELRKEPPLLVAGGLYVISGKFTRLTADGFQASDGVIAYHDYQRLDADAAGPKR